MCELWKISMRVVDSGFCWVGLGLVFCGGSLVWFEYLFAQQSLCYLIAFVKSIKKWLGLFPRGGFNVSIRFSRAGYVSWHFCCSVAQGMAFSLLLEDSALKAPSWWPCGTLRQTPELRVLVLNFPISMTVRNRHLRYSATATQSRLAGHFLSMTPLGFVWGEGKDYLARGHLNLLCQGIYGTGPGKLAAVRTAKICSVAWQRKKLVILVATKIRWTLKQTRLSAWVVFSWSYFLHDFAHTDFFLWDSFHVSPDGFKLGV